MRLRVLRLLRIPFEENCQWSATKRQGSTTIALGHRFYGLSNPHPNLSIKSFEALAANQAFEDFDHVEKNVGIPFPGGDQVGPEKVPWVVIGEGYSGALAS